MWFEHTDATGAKWEDTDDGTGGERAADDASENVRERFLGIVSLRVDGAAIPCRVFVRESSSTPFQRSHAVREWVSSRKRWVAADPGLRGLVLREADLGTEVRYRDGRRERVPGLWSESVRTLHDRVRVAGRSYDCWVVTRKVQTPTGEFAERTSTWHYDGMPTGWVKRSIEARDPRNGAMTRTEELVVGFRYE